MKDTTRITRTIVATLAATIFLGSCSIGLSPDTTGPEDDLARLDEELNLTANSAVTAAEAQLEASGGIGASTTYNNPSMVPVTVVGADGAVDLPARSDYPYPGWTTTGTVEHISDPDGYAAVEGWNDTTSGYDWKDELGSANLFKMTITATPDSAGIYPEETVKEVYYVIDTTGKYGDFAGGGDDSIFDPYGDAGTGYRDEYVATYTDTSIREHWIIADPNTTYTAFDVDGSLDFDTIEAGGIVTEGAAVYSSATMYTHELGKTFNYWFWNNSDDITPYIVGTRYYTEHLVGNELVGTSLTVEYTYDNAWQTSNTTPEVLARTVIREEIRFDHDDQNNDGIFDNGEAGAATGHTLRLQTAINNNSGGQGLVYTRQGKSLSDWKRRGGGNPGEAQLAGIQRDTLPTGYSNLGDFDAVITDIVGPE